jgi:hypothetical protein
MSEQPSHHATPPQVFGPVKPHLSDHSEDHERGWHEALEAPEGAKVARVREAPRVPLAERFRRRLSEAEAEHGKDR